MRLECKLEISLTPEARIISEDDTHAVIALLIEKAWLARNLHFFAALADCATTTATVLPVT
jgi:hypothetical protein